MTPEEFAEQMRAIKLRHKGDQEAMPSEAIALICDVLNEKGYIEGVKIFTVICRELGCA